MFETDQFDTFDAPLTRTSPEPHVSDEQFGKVVAELFGNSEDGFWERFETFRIDQQYARHTKFLDEHQKLISARIYFWTWEVQDRLAEASTAKTFDIQEMGRLRRAEEVLIGIHRLLISYPNWALPLSKDEQRNVKNWFRLVGNRINFDWFKLEKKNTAYATKAVLKRWVIYKAQELLKALDLQTSYAELSALAQDEIYKTGHMVEWAADAGVFDNRAVEYKGRWKQHKDELSFKKLVGEEITPDDLIKTKKTKTKRKAQLLNKLPKGWDEDFAERMGFDPAIDTIRVTGIRTCELRGCRLYLGKNEEFLICVQGKKVSKKTGQIERVLEIRLNHPAAKRLYQLLLDGYNFEFAKVNINALRLKMRRASLKMFCGVISPNIYRHLVAKELKDDDGQQKNYASAAMGHRASKTVAGYGNKRLKGQVKSTARSTILSARATFPVKNTNSEFYHRKIKRVSSEIDFTPMIPKNIEPAQPGFRMQ